MKKTSVNDSVTDINVGHRNLVEIAALTRRGYSVSFHEYYGGIKAVIRNRGDVMANGMGHTPNKALAEALDLLSETEERPQP